MASSVMPKLFSLSDFEMGIATTNSSGASSVSFSKAHTNPPTIVLASGVGGANQIRFTSVNSISATGFNCLTTNNLGSSISANVHWLAIWE